MGEYSFVVYNKYKARFKRWGAKKGYAVFMAMLEYSDTGEIIIPDEYYDAFEPIKEDMDENARKYEKICERNKINGQKGGAPKGNQNARKTTQTTQSVKNNPNNPKQHEYDYEYEYDNEFKKKERKKEKDEFNLPFSPVNGSRRINKLTKLSDVGGGFM